MAFNRPRPTWLAFDCSGTLIQWGEGLVAAMEAILGRKGRKIEAETFIPSTMVLKDHPTPIPVGLRERVSPFAHQTASSTLC
nr:hypothetical protein [Mesorhizobium sp.]